MGAVDWRGVAIFLGLSFLGGWILQALFLFTGLLNYAAPGVFGYAAMVGLMVWPGACAALARQLAPLPPQQESRVWPLPAISTLRVVAAVPLLMLLGFGLAWLVGWTQPDWTVSELVYSVKQNLITPLPPEAEPLLPMFLLAAGISLSIIMGISVYALLFFFMEYGWRGYLLPKLLPLGAWPAILLTAIGPFLYGLPILLYLFLTAPEALDDLPETAIQLAALSMGTGALLGALWLRSRHLGLVAVAAGTLFGHMSGVWDALFPNDFWVLTGSTGIIFSALCLGLAFFPQILVAGPRARRD